MPSITEGLFGAIQDDRFWQDIKKNLNNVSTAAIAGVPGLPGDILQLAHLMSGGRTPAIPSNWRSEGMQRALGGDPEHVSSLIGGLLSPGPGEVSHLPLALGAVFSHKGLANKAPHLLKKYFPDDLVDETIDRVELTGESPLAIVSKTGILPYGSDLYTNVASKDFAIDVPRLMSDMKGREVGWNKTTPISQVIKGHPYLEAYPDLMKQNSIYAFRGQPNEMGHAAMPQWERVIELPESFQKKHKVKYGILNEAGYINPMVLSNDKRFLEGIVRGMRSEWKPGYVGVEQHLLDISNPEIFRTLGHELRHLTEPYSGLGAPMGSTIGAMDRQILNYPANLNLAEYAREYNKLKKIYGDDEDSIEALMFLKAREDDPNIIPESFSGLFGRRFKNPPAIDLREWIARNTFFGVDPRGLLTGQHAYRKTAGEQLAEWSGMADRKAVMEGRDLGPLDTVEILKNDLLDPRGWIRNPLYFDPKDEATDLEKMLQYMQDELNIGLP